MTRNWTDRFARFIRTKTDAATSATLPGYVTVESHGADLELGIVGNAWTFERFDGPFFESSPVDARWPAVNAVFVQSADGNTGSDNPTSLGGGATDKHLIYEGLSSVHADALLTAPGTIGGSQTVMAVWHPELVRLRTSLGLPRFPAQVVATRRGQLAIDAELLYNVPEVPVFILTTNDGARALTAAVAARPWITVIATGAESDLAAGLERLRADYGIRRVSCTGGRHITTALIEAGVVCDLYLTTSPRTGGEPNTPFYLGEKPLDTTVAVRKRGRDEEQGVTFEHLILRP